MAGKAGGTVLKSYMYGITEDTKNTLLNVIKQPIWASGTITTATPEASVRLFQTTQAGSSIVATSMKLAGMLAKPKTFWIRGVRKHVLQDVVQTDATSLVQFVTHVKLDENYVIDCIVGEKSFLNVPLYYLSSGLGVHAEQIGSLNKADTNLMTYTSHNGMPIHDNYFKIPGNLEVIIPPNQQFYADLIKGTTAANLGTGGNRTVVIYYEGAYGRESQ